MAGGLALSASAFFYGFVKLFCIEGDHMCVFFHEYLLVRKGSVVSVPDRSFEVKH